MALKAKCRTNLQNREEYARQTPGHVLEADS
jgi:hypothetical protein